MASSSKSSLVASMATLVSSSRTARSLRSMTCLEVRFTAQGDAGNGSRAHLQPGASPSFPLQLPVQVHILIAVPDLGRYASGRTLQRATCCGRYRTTSLSCLGALLRKLELLDSGDRCCRAHRTEVLTHNQPMQPMSVPVGIGNHQETLHTLSTSFQECRSSPTSIVSLLPFSRHLHGGGYCFCETPGSFDFIWFFAGVTATA